MEPNTIPKCSKCAEEQQKATMQIVAADCWNCHKPMKLALVLLTGTCVGPESFTDQQVELARSKNVIIREQHSKTANSNYLANTCPSCNSFIGEFFIHEYLYDDKAENIDAGYFCLKCHYAGRI
jgi:hypothetical protein